MTKDELAERLRVIAEQAPALRLAGVTTIAIDGVSFTMSPPERPEDDVDDDDDDGADKTRRGGLNDPDLYPGRGVPRRDRGQG